MTAFALPSLASSPDARPGRDATTAASSTPSISADATAHVADLKRDAPARTAYTEVRFSGLLDRPLILRGELEYLGPDKLGKRVDTPYREQTTIADGEAVVRRGDQAPRRFALSRAPELEGFLHGFAALLGGDAKALQQDFSLSSTGDAAHWRLILKPRDSRLARHIKAIEVDGSGKSARCFRTREADDDVSVLLIGPLAATNLSSHPTPGAIALLCRGGDAAQ
ncbi:MAG: LolA-related protein [Rhodanobacteraceae bacterium]